MAMREPKGLRPQLNHRGHRRLGAGGWLHPRHHRPIDSQRVVAASQEPDGIVEEEKSVDSAAGLRKAERGGVSRDNKNSRGRISSGIRAEVPLVRDEEVVVRFDEGWPAISEEAAYQIAAISEAFNALAPHDPATILKGKAILVMCVDQLRHLTNQAAKLPKA